MGFGGCGGGRGTYLLSSEIKEEKPKDTPKKADEQVADHEGDEPIDLFKTLQ